MPTRHKLGLAYGLIVDYDDGTAGYIPPGAFREAFRVRVADVTGFSDGTAKSALKRTLNVLGNGTVLGSATVNHGSAQKVEAWFREHPNFRPRPGTPLAGTEPARPNPSPVPIADELRKLAELRAEGLLTDDEFAAQKSRLLGS